MQCCNSWLPVVASLVVAMRCDGFTYLLQQRLHAHRATPAAPARHPLPLAQLRPNLHAQHACDGCDVLSDAAIDVVWPAREGGGPHCVGTRSPCPCAFLLRRAILQRCRTMETTTPAAAAVKQEQDAAGSSQAEAVSPMQVTSKQEPEVKQEPQHAAAAHASTTEAQEKQPSAPAAAAAAAAAEVKAEAGPSSSAAEGAGKEGADADKAGPSSTPPPPVDPEELLKVSGEGRVGGGKGREEGRGEGGRDSGRGASSRCR